MRLRESEAAMMRTAPFLLLLTGFTSAVAQERPLPPTRITLPSDTLAARRTPAKIDADSSRIELPEVLVLGRDRSVRQVESKQRSGDDQPRLIQPEYLSLSIFGRRDNNRPLVNAAAAARERMYWAGAGAGTYSTLTANGGYSGTYPWGSTRLTGWFDRSNGAFHNSQHRDGGLTASATTPLRPALHGRAEAAADWLTRGLHGAALPHPTRSARLTSLQGEAEFALDPASSARAGLRLAGAGVSSDTSGREWRHTGDFTFSMHGDYQRQLEKLTLRASAAYQRESLSPGADSLDGAAGFGRIRAEVQTSLLAPLQLTAAVGYESCAGSRFAPALRLAWLPNDRWGLSLIAWAGLRYRSYSERLRENPYIAHALPLAADDSPLSLQARADFRPAGRLLFQFGAYHGRFDRLHYWERDGATGLIGLQQARDVALTEIQASAQIRFESGMTLQGEMQINSDHLQHPVSLGADDRIPYRPDFAARAAVSVPLPWQLELTSRLEMAGERRRGLDLEGRLPRYNLISAGLGRTFGRHLSAAVDLYNLLDSPYVIWEGYDEPGTRIMAQIKYIY